MTMLIDLLGVPEVQKLTLKSSVNDSKGGGVGVIEECASAIYYVSKQL